MTVIAVPKSQKTRITLLVSSVETYTKKETGEVRVSVQAIEAVPEGARKKGYGLVNYTAEPSIYDAVNFNGGLLQLSFFAEPREARNGFGNTTNQLHLLELIEEAPRNTPPAAGKPAGEAKA